MDNENIHPEVDNEICQYLDLDNPKSFLLFAGAGSGKTRTLVNVLQRIRDKDLPRLIQNGQRIAVITFTNAACDEIQHRLKFDPIFAVSTIHSFIWELIKPFSEDIKIWLRKKLSEDIAELSASIAKARDPNSKTALKNTKSRESKIKRLEELDSVINFTYSPTTTRQDKGTLNHSEIISLGAEFISNQPLMKNVLVKRFPILLIDESQDTNKDLLEAFIATQQAKSHQFSLGLFGDLMQRIYSGGKEDLDRSLPDDWEKPEKVINYRSPKRVIELINRIRSEDDGKQQTGAIDAEEGIIRIFIINSNRTNKSQIELDIVKRMAEITDDKKWILSEEVKTLTLEHAMAASRGEFSRFYLPLSSVDSLRDSVLGGTSSTIKFITEQFLPLTAATLIDDDFEIARIVKKYSRIFHSTNQLFVNNPLSVLEDLKKSIKDLKKLLQDDSVTFRSALLFVVLADLLIAPDNLYALLVEDNATTENKVEVDDEDEDEDEDEDDTELGPQQAAWNMALEAPLNHVFNYSKYISGNLGFSTHQGVKGLEFERVMAIIDDSDANGFLFKYDKLFGAVDLSKIDRDNEALGKDSVVARTRRLFYVICSRAEKSLAIVAYSEDPDAVRQRVISSNWFSAEEIIML